MKPLERSFFQRDATAVAPQLLNKVFVVGLCSGRISEVEAYTQDDAASHSFRGMTARNATMFGPGGLLYVYFIYGMHFCANVVTGRTNDGQAVLIRAVIPLRGQAVMIERRGRLDRLADGPAKLCEAFGIDRSFDGVDLCVGDRAHISDDGVLPPRVPDVTRRVGISAATDLRRRWSIPSA